jgi:exodeoxyribonuclease VII large subunit
VAIFQQSGNQSNLSLSELAALIQETIESRHGRPVWVRAELHKLNFYERSGHCYPELVEKADGQLLAQMKANLWKDDYKAINARFIRVLGEPLRDGIKVLLKVTVNFHAVYGLALRIEDIDPAFTLGDLERDKMETIDRLRSEGLLDANKRKSLALLPQRIAVISDQTSQGYADFLNTLNTNPWGYAYFTMLFPSALQGEQAVLGIPEQLARIARVAHHFDSVAIVRGGGGEIGLSAYNRYQVAKAIAHFPIPVLTGIGHSVNNTVSDMVAYHDAITPTKLAEFYIQQMHNFSVPLKRGEEALHNFARRRIQWSAESLEAEGRVFRQTAKHLTMQYNQEVLAAANQLAASTAEQVHAAAYMVDAGLRTMQDLCRQLFSVERKYIVSVTAGTLRKASAGLRVQQHQVQWQQQHLRSQVAVMLHQNQMQLSKSRYSWPLRIQTLLQGRSSELTGLSRVLDGLNPQNLLNKGYSITLLNGKPVKQIQEVPIGAEIETRIADGSIFSTVNNIETNRHE